MQAHITYVRPKTTRVVSGWKDIDSTSGREVILYGYEDHGFKVTEVTKNKFLASHIADGIRVIEFRG